MKEVNDKLKHISSGSFKSGVNQYGNQEERERTFANKFNQMFSGRAEYVNGFTNVDSKFNCKCKKCNSIYSLSAQVVRKNGSAECHICVAQSIIEKKERCRSTKDFINVIKKVNRLKVKEQNILKKELDKLDYLKERECNHCGNKFVSSKSNLYCSIECMKKSNDYHKSARRREKIRSNGHYDWSISIPKLIKRDKVCKLCGEQVDINDRVNAKGTVIVGKNYPSIDHIIPVSKGGTHTWDNVQLAHVGCNVRKSNTTDIVARVGRIQLSLNV